MLFNNFIPFHIAIWKYEWFDRNQITYSGPKVGLLTSYNTFLSITYGFSNIIELIHANSPELCRLAK